MKAGGKEEREKMGGKEGKIYGGSEKEEDVGGGKRKEVVPCLLPYLFSLQPYFTSFLNLLMSLLPFLFSLHFHPYLLPSFPSSL